MRRFDQGVGKIAQLPFVVGELELRCAQADAARRLGADSSMHVVADEIPAGAAEIDHSCHVREKIDIGL